MVTINAKKKLIFINRKLNEKNIDCIFHLPKDSKKRFYLKDKNVNYSIWPTIIPTSCISFKRIFFIKFLKFLKRNDYENLEIDARLTIFSKFYLIIHRENCNKYYLLCYRPTLRL